MYIVDSGQCIVYIEYIVDSVYIKVPIKVDQAKGHNWVLTTSRPMSLKASIPLTVWGFASFS